MNQLVVKLEEKESNLISMKEKFEQLEEQYSQSEANFKLAQEKIEQFQSQAGLAKERFDQLEEQLGSTNGDFKKVICWVGRCTVIVTQACGKLVNRKSTCAGAR